MRGRTQEKFDTTKEGFAKWLPESESLLLEYLFRHPEGVTVKEAHEWFINESHDLRYTTIGTHFTALCHRGLATREEFRQDGGIAYIYRPASSREETLEKLIHDVLFPLLRDHPKITFRVLRLFLPKRRIS